MESCQSLQKRSPWGRLGSVGYTCKRLHRIRGRLQHISAKSLSSAAHKTMNYLANGFQSSRRAPRIGACGVGDYPTPDLSRRESEGRSASKKSKQFGPDGAPFPFWGAARPGDLAYRHTRNPYICIYYGIHVYKLCGWWLLKTVLSD